MSNSWMIQAMEHCGYRCCFTRKLGDWRITVYRERKIVYETHGLTEASVIRRAYYFLIDPDTEPVRWQDEAIHQRVVDACEAAHRIVAAMREAQR